MQNALRLIHGAGDIEPMQPPARMLSRQRHQPRHPVRCRRNPCKCCQKQFRRLAGANQYGGRGIHRIRLLRRLPRQPVEQPGHGQCHQQRQSQQYGETGAGQAQTGANQQQGQHHPGQQRRAADPRQILQRCEPPMQPGQPEGHPDQPDRRGPGQRQCRRVRPQHRRRFQPIGQHHAKGRQHTIKRDIDAKPRDKTGIAGAGHHPSFSLSSRARTSPRPRPPHRAAGRQPRWSSGHAARPRRTPPQPDPRRRSSPPHAAKTPGRRR